MANPTPALTDACLPGRRLFPPVEELASEMHSLGIGSVVQCATAIGVFFGAATVLLQLGLLIRAEQMMARAAADGLREATLPAATRSSVEAVVLRHLTCWPGAGPSGVALEVRGQPVCGRLRARLGDPIAVTVLLPTGSILPKWFRWTARWVSLPSLQVRAESVAGVSG